MELYIYQFCISTLATTLVYSLLLSNKLMGDTFHPQLTHAVLLAVENDTISDLWDKVFKNGPSKIFQRLSSTNITWSTLEYFVSYIPHRIIVL